MQKDAEEQRKKQEAEAIQQSIIQQKIDENTPTAEAGEKAIN